MLEGKDVCCSGNVKTLILACAGGSNVGQVSNRAMIELEKKGMGNAYCLAGIGADLSGFVESAKAANTILIDGCPVACGKKSFEKHGITPTRYIVVTELGVEKNHNFDNLETETAEAIKKML
jgi:uncharacterized metal-binding protein